MQVFFQLLKFCSKVFNSISMICCFSWDLIKFLNSLKFFQMLILRSKSYLTKSKFSKLDLLLSSISISISCCWNNFLSPMAFLILKDFSSNNIIGPSVSSLYLLIWSSFNSSWIFSTISSYFLILDIKSNLNCFIFCSIKYCIESIFLS